MALAELLFRDHARIVTRDYARTASAVDDIRVFVADSHPMVRRGLAAVLAAESHLHWVGEAGDGADAVRAALALRPHVVVIDQGVPGMEGIDVIEALHRLLPATRFVLTMASFEAHDVRRAIAAGATCIVLRSASSQELVNAILAAHRGQCQHPAVLTHGLDGSSRSVGADLTPRERDLLGLMAQGMRNQEISGLLNITIPTVKFHISNILRKLHAENRTTAVLVALRHKVVGQN